MERIFNTTGIATHKTFNTNLYHHQQMLKDPAACGLSEWDYAVNLARLTISLIQQQTFYVVVVFYCVIELKLEGTSRVHLVQPMCIVLLCYEQSPGQMLLLFHLNDATHIDGTEWMAVATSVFCLSQMDSWPFYSAFGGPCSFLALENTVRERVFHQKPIMDQGTTAVQYHCKMTIMNLGW